TKNWAPNQWVGYGVKVTISGTDYWAGVTSNTANRLYLAPALDSAPNSGTDTYIITDFSITGAAAEGSLTTPLGNGCGADGITKPGTVNMGAILDFVKNTTDGLMFNSIQDANDDTSLSPADTLTIYTQDEATGSILSATDYGPFLNLDMEDETTITADNQYEGMYLYITSGTNAGKYFLITDSQELSTAEGDSTDTDTISILVDSADGFNLGDTFVIVDRVYDRKASSQANFKLTTSGASGGAIIIWNVDGTVIVDGKNQVSYNVYADSNLDSVKLTQSIKLINATVSSLGGKPYTTYQGYYQWGETDPPSGLGNFSVSSVTSTSATLSWSAVTDANFNHYEIWYGTVLADVEARSGTALEWDDSNDINLADAATTTTTITGLDLANNTYYFKIWAIDDYGNEATTDYIELADWIWLTSPDGGEEWEVGFSHQITWQSRGTISNELTIEYSTDGGATWKLISDQQYNDGSYSWTVPDDTSDTVKVRVRDIYAPYCQDISDNYFKIAPNTKITVTSPDGGESWIIGTEHIISWENIGNVYPTVDLEYSTDSGSTWNTIALGVENSGSYNWTIPDDLSDDCLVKVTESGIPSGRDTQAQVSDTSDNVFSIVNPVITVTQPNGGEIWVYQDIREITWQTTGSVSDNLLIEYSKDDFVSDVNTIATGVANTGSFSWTVVLDPSSTVKIRITDVDRPAVFDTSDNYFELLEHSRIIITSPNGGETLIIGDVHTITWSWDGQGVSNNLTIEYSTDSGSTWNLIADQQYNDGSYSWTVPNVQTSTALLRITDASDSLITDTSDSVFTISIPVINVTSPNGGETWNATGTYDITWTSVGGVSDNLLLEYSTDSGSTWDTIATAVINSGSYSWSLPDIISSNCLVRITDSNRVEVFDTSDAEFSIIAPSITVTSPNGGEEWVVGTTQDITWTSTGSDVGAVSNNLTIEYSTDGGNSWITINTEQQNDGAYSWTIPDNPSTTCRVKIYDADRPATFDISDNDFIITHPTFHITSPNGGESWIIGTTHDITWETVGSVSSDLRLEYSKDNFVSDINLIVTGIANTGSFSWAIPDDASNTVKVRITDNLRPEATDTSDASFAIANPIVTITSPNGGELWTVEDTEQITWETVGSVSSDLRLEYSKDNFVSDIILIATGVANTGSYSWTIPDDTSTTVRVRITDNTRSATWDKSNADFTILPVPVITITAPNGEENWIIGTEQEITWTDNGGLISNNLTIQYSTDSGSTWNTIATGEPNDGSFTWTIPDDYSIFARVKIFDAERPSTYDISDSDFTIALPVITITYPNGGEYFAVGDNVPVSWTTEGAVSNNLVFEYTTDGSNFTLIATGVPNDGSYIWTVPDEVSSTVKIKITDGDRANSYDLSDSGFNIIAVPEISITTPNGGEEYEFGDTMSISWEHKGLSVSDNLTIDYSLDDFATSTIIATGVSNSGSYSWVIPEDALAGSTLKVRITDAERPEVTDTSDGYFRIKGGFVIIAPNGGESWYVGTTQTISWQTKGTIPNVKLEYSLDSGATWNTIVDSVANNESYSWTVPKEKSTQARVKISDVTDSTVYAVSEADFSLIYYTITWYVLDYDNYSHLRDLSVSDSVWEDSSGTLVSPVTYEYPYGSYTTFWSKEGYIERSIDWVADGNKTVTVYLENQTTALVEWHVLVSTAYEASTDTLKASAWLERKGALVGDQTEELGDLQGATLDIYEGDTLIESFSNDSPDSRGIYWFTWEDTNLEGGKTYFVKATIKYRDREYTSGGAVDVTEAKQAYEETQQLQIIQAQNATIQEKVESEIPSKIKSAKEEIKTDTSKILVATEETIPTKISETKEKVETAMKSEILNRENTVRSGDTLVIRYRTYSGLSPTIDVYNPDNVLVINKGIMTEVDTTGIYEYPVTFLSSWGRGDFTIVCSESTKGTLDALIITVLTTDIEEVAGEVAAVLGETTGLGEFEEVADTLNNQLSLIESALSKISEDIVNKVKEAGSAASELEAIYNQLVNISEKIKEMRKLEAPGLEELYKVLERRKNDLLYLKNKTQELKTLVELNNKMIGNITYRPITQAWYEFR
ncbi:MAG: hypothetical protein DRP76_00975, partial [Candidatus Omnitrophota bacterium]